TLVHASCMPVLVRCSFRVFFFFQAEDGIRGRNVTGVQTCALPILLLRSVVIPGVLPPVIGLRCRTLPLPGRAVYRLGFSAPGTRSEERRVGKECRAWRAAERLKDNMTAEDAQSMTLQWRQRRQIAR